jgi:predicted lipid-binding transport protein (Tim44 family)
MSGCSFRRFVAAALVAVAGTALIATSFDAEARRAGGGGSFGRQSSNVTTQRQATTPPSASNQANSTAAPAAGAATAGAATAGAATARSGASRWLGPIAGIAAGLGIAALLSHLGLSGAFAEMLGSLLLIALVVFAVLFIVRRLRAGTPRPAMQGAYGAARQADTKAPAPAWRAALPAAGGGASASLPADRQIAAGQPAAVQGSDVGGDWVIPGDFDTQRFVEQAKEQFVRIQAIWDTGDTDRLREYLTDDLVAELKPQLTERGQAANRTEVVLLNAEMLGIEAVSDGHLASVRFSGMLREAPGSEAFRFEEVWNLFKPAQGGWLLAGIQQIPVQAAS